MAPSLVTFAPTIAPTTASGDVCQKLRPLLAEAWAYDAQEVHTVVSEFVRQHIDDSVAKDASTEAVLQAMLDAQNDDRVLAELSNLVPICGEATKLTRWWRQCVRYLSMFELVKVSEGAELDTAAFEVKCSKLLQQRAGALLFSRLDDEARYCVDICVTSAPGATFALLDVAKAVTSAIQSNSRPTPLEQEVTEDKANGNMWFIMDSWDAPAKVMSINDPIATTQNFLAVYERYLADPALLVFYVQVLRECSVAAANCLLQDKFMEGDMLSIKHVGDYINDKILPLLRVTKPMWDVDAANDDDDEDEGAPKEAVRNLHWSRAKRCFGCGSAEHALNNCNVLPPDCSRERLEEIRASAVIPPGYKWRAAKTVLKMHKYSPALRNRQGQGQDRHDTSSEMDDTFMSGV